MKALISGATGLIGRSFLTKYSKEFDGQAQVTKVLEVPNGYLWVDWHYGFGMILANRVKLADDQSKCIVATPKYMRRA